MTRVTLKAINAELARLGATTRLARASGYFYFQFGEAVNWLDRTVQVSKVSDLSLNEWIGEYKRVKKVNFDLVEVASVIGSCAPTSGGTGRSSGSHQRSRRGRSGSSRICAHGFCAVSWSHSRLRISASSSVVVMALIRLNSGGI